jgi:hypothetical protein
VGRRRVGAGAGEKAAAADLALEKELGAGEEVLLVGEWRRRCSEWVARGFRGEKTRHVGEDKERVDER